MWEWSNQKQQNGSLLPFNAEDSSLLYAYDDLLKQGLAPSSQPFQNSIAKQKQKQKQNQHNINEMEYKLQRKLKEFNLTTFHLEIFPYLPQTWEKQTLLYQELWKIRYIFLKRLAYKEEYKLKNIGLNFQDINLLKQGITPENFNVHIKIPFDFGGKAELNNLCFMRAHPVHDNLHKIIDIQLSNNFLYQEKMLFIPITEGNICHD